MTPLAERSGIAYTFAVTVEDDKGRYYAVFVIALNAEDAGNRVNAILDRDKARVTGIAS